VTGSILFFQYASNTHRYTSLAINSASERRQRERRKRELRQRERRLGSGAKGAASKCAASKCAASRERHGASPRVNAAALHRLPTGGRLGVGDVRALVSRANALPWHRGARPYTGVGRSAVVRGGGLAVAHARLSSRDCGEAEFGGRHGGLRLTPPPQNNYDLFKTPGDGKANPTCLGAVPPVGVNPT
jgi:hypothetical protein